MSNRRQSNIDLAIKKLKAMLQTMDYGNITLHVQDSYVVQVEKNEKIRLK